MSSEEKKVIDLSYLQEVASDNSDFMVEMIDIFLAQTPEYMSTLEEAVNTQTWAKIAEMAHKIKPTLAFMGALEAKESMASIEARARGQEDYEGIKKDFAVLKEDFRQIFAGLEQKRAELLG
ncbi:histidine phosphotransferase [Pelobium manganitolerans]|uniref:Histidine phosphotransferase n=1 Tax=Pelobium manganitolerans TaxID=1842495 RepID=A0A419S3X8_9SPHI|nr:Hpt domain-containing protein [Pelobium manganitolerans]RKD14346.1 histidine phosphotransferase [Pelobium manganitolerans]